MIRFFSVVAVLIHTRIQVDNDIDSRNQNLRCDEDNDNPLKVLPCKQLVSKPMPYTHPDVGKETYHACDSADPSAQQADLQ